MKLGRKKKQFRRHAELMLPKWWARIVLRSWLALPSQAWNRHKTDAEARYRRVRAECNAEWGRRHMKQGAHISAPHLRLEAGLRGRDELQSAVLRHF